MPLYDISTRLGEGPDGLFLNNQQTIGGDFLDHLRASRDVSPRAPAGDHMHVASIPVIVVERWLREGFNIYREPAREIVKRLRSEGLDAFLATSRRV